MAATHPITIPAIAPPEMDEPPLSELIGDVELVGSEVDVVLVGPEVAAAKTPVSEMAAEHAVRSGLHLNAYYSKTHLMREQCL